MLRSYTPRARGGDRISRVSLRRGRRLARAIAHVRGRWVRSSRFGPSVTRSNGRWQCVRHREAGVGRSQIAARMPPRTAAEAVEQIAHAGISGRIDALETLLPSPAPRDLGELEQVDGRAG